MKLETCLSVVVAVVTISVLPISVYGQTVGLGEAPPNVTALELPTVETPGPEIEGNASAPMTWKTYNDPILQFSIEYPSTWGIDIDEGSVLFFLPTNTLLYQGLEVIVEPVLTRSFGVCKRYAKRTEAIC